ncbi:MAG: NFACT RNA binding domain-containing protein [Bacteroidota bacterium]
MHFHYWTLLALADWMRNHLLGKPLLEAYSQNKNELILAWENHVLRVGCQTPLTYLIPVQEFSKARRNVVELFEEIYKHSLLDIQVVPYERVLIFYFEEDYELIFKLHGIAANIILQKAGTVIHLFNQDRKDDLNLSISPGYFQEEALTPTEEPGTEQEVLTQLRRVAPVFEKQFAARVWEDMQEEKTFSQAAAAIIEEASSGSYYLQQEATKIKFLIIRPAGNTPCVKLEGVASALQVFLKAHYQFSIYRKRYQHLEKEIGKPLKKLKKVYASYQHSIHQMETERSPEELGHLLLANIHQIPQGSKKITVEDYFQGGQVSIKLKEGVSPQENAQRYYEKHKQRKSRLSYLKDQLTDLQDKIQEAEEDWNTFSALPKPVALKLGETGFDQQQIRNIKAVFRTKEKELKEEANSKYPFRVFKRSGYDIFVGRNARNNDILSFKFAHKEDLWLHAKDVAGSHVVIRKKGGQNVPLAVLEYAAQLAAFYSKRKNDTLVPVLYTPRKYVRKRKGDPPGMVVVNREDVIMVEPLRE